MSTSNPALTVVQLCSVLPCAVNRPDGWLWSCRFCGHKSSLTRVRGGSRLKNKKPASERAWKLYWDRAEKSFRTSSTSCRFLTSRTAAAHRTEFEGDATSSRSVSNLPASSLIFLFAFLSQVHVVQTPQGEDYEGRTFHGKRVSELHLQPPPPLVFNLKDH